MDWRGNDPDTLHGTGTGTGNGMGTIENNGYIYILVPIPVYCVQYIVQYRNPSFPGPVQC